MTPEAALDRQIERYRAMTGEQRLKIALDLHQFACDIARAGIRRQFPSAAPDEIDAHLRRRIELGSLDHDNARRLAKSLGLVHLWNDIAAGKLLSKST